MVIDEDVKYILSLPLPWEKLINKTIMITGSNGFIVSWIRRVLEEIQHEFNIQILLIPNINGGILQQTKFYDNNIDYIFHAASYASPVVFKQNPVGTMLPNILGTYNLLESIKEKKAEFIFFSTSGVYGWTNDYPLSEEDFGKLDCAKIENCYLESKRCGEMLCMAYQNQYHIPVKILRLGICYGYGMKLDDGRLMNTWIKNILDKKNLVITYNVWRSFLYITDVISAIFHIMLKGKNEPYNIAAEYELDIIQISDIIKKLYPEIEIQYEIDDMNRLSVNFSQTWMNVFKLKNLGWNQKYNFKEGFKRTLDAYKL